MKADPRGPYREPFPRTREPNAANEADAAPGSRLRGVLCGGPSWSRVTSTLKSGVRAQSRAPFPNAALSGHADSEAKFTAIAVRAVLMARLPASLPASMPRPSAVVTIRRSNTVCPLSMRAGR